MKIYRKTNKWRENFIKNRNVGYLKVFSGKVLVFSTIKTVLRLS